MKRLLTVSLLIAILAFQPVIARPSKGSPEKTFKLPATAQNLGSNVYKLGKKVDPTTNKQVEGYAFITPKKGYGKPDHAGGPKGGGGETSSTCYAFMSKGAKWHSAEPWSADMTNNQGLDSSELFSTQAASLEKWETGAGNQIFGAGTQQTGLTADESAPDGKNEVVFGSIDEPGVIAVTIVWGYFSGSPQQRGLIEWDQIFDQESFDWSLSGEAGKMDFENIATHEDGHAAGLSHPDDSCTEETMYRYASTGETQKRTLEAGDIAGISSLY